MTLQEQRDKINSIVRWIGYTVYASQSKQYRFIKAYDRLTSKVLVDHDFSISTSSQGENIFDDLNKEEMTLVLQSALELGAMYTKAFESQAV